jgi:hypothetical protein
MRRSGYDDGMDKRAISDKLDKLIGPVRDEVWVEIYAEIIEPILEANPGWTSDDAVKHLQATGRWGAVKQDFEARGIDAIVKAIGEDEIFTAMVREMVGDAEHFSPGEEE